MNKYNSTLAKLFSKDTIFSHKKALMDMYYLSGMNLFSFKSLHPPIHRMDNPAKILCPSPDVENKRILNPIFISLQALQNYSTLHPVNKSLKYNGPLTWNNFSQSMDNNNLFNVGISKFKNFLKDLLLENY